MKVVMIPGDGIGKEISESVLQISDALHTGITWKVMQAGAEYCNENGRLMENGLLEAVTDSGIALKGPTATPIGQGFRSLNVQLRHHFGSYANLRPVHSHRGVPSRYEDIDLVIVRENSEDLYRGIEYRYDQDTVHGIKVITRQASERIARFAFSYARKHHRRKVTAVHKANIMKLADGLFLEAFRNAAAEFPEIEADTVIVDALCMKLVLDPNQFDVLVAPNLYGDIISDLCAGLIGGLGFSPSVNISDSVRIYEAVHGSAPDIAGQDKANPTALLLSFAMLLKDNGMADKAEKLEAAIDDILCEGRCTTADIGGKAGTKAFTSAVLERISHD